MESFISGSQASHMSSNLRLESDLMRLFGVEFESFMQTPKEQCRGLFVELPLFICFECETQKGIHGNSSAGIALSEF